MAALEVCRRWRAAGPDRRIIVVVPTDNLREQWKDEATKFGMSLQTKELGTDFKDGFQGGVATYHLVASQPELFRKLCAVAPTLVVFDEIHHCGDEAHFGRGIKEGFKMARERLLMSGTPWKSDGAPIPYVSYDGSGYALGNFYYDYPRALTEDVVRYLVFDYAKGSITNDCSGKTESLTHEISDDEARGRLKRILHPDGEYVKRQIYEAHQRLLECRRKIPDAAALAACIDQYQAGKVADVIREVTGCEPSIIVSDGDLENDSVRQFRKSKKEWLVAVRKVSEGTDIKRLQVLCYLTNTTSELFFRQIIGRVSRVRGMEDFESYVYLPADPRLVRCAINIQNAQVQALRDQSEREERDMGEQEQQQEFAPYSTCHDGTDVVLIGGEHVPLEEAKEIERISVVTGHAMQAVRQILAAARDVCTTDDSEDITEVSKEDRMDELRKKCSKAAFRLSKIKDIPVKDIHKNFNRQKTMTEQELHSKLKQLVQECNKP